MTEQNEGRTRLILHVGMHKTGTSYLQKLLLFHRWMLGEESVGLAEPIDENVGSHHQLVGFLDEGDEGFERFLAGLNTGFPCTLVSSESLLHWLAQSNRADELAAILNERFDVTVVLYVRRQDYMKESVFAEVATSWYQGSIQDEKHYTFDYAVLVDRLVELFGAEALRLGIYRDDQRQDIASDFLSLAGLERLIGRFGLIPPERVSANRRQVALLALCPKDDPESFERLRRAVLTPGVIAADSSKYQLSPEQRSFFLEAYVSSNRRLTRAFRPDAEDYLTDISPRQEDWSPPAPYTPAEVVALLLQLAGVISRPALIGVDALVEKVRGFVESRRWLLLLHDGALKSSFVAQVTELAGAVPTILDVRCSHPSALEYMPAKTGILYACLKDDIGLHFLDAAYARGMQVQPVSYSEPRDYHSRNTFARRSLRQELDRQRVAGYLPFDHGTADYANLVQAYEATRSRGGWIVEVGCAGGSSAGVLLAYVRSRQEERGYPSHCFHFMDAFAQEGSDGSASEGYELVRDRIKAYGQEMEGTVIEVSSLDVISDPIPEPLVREGVRLVNIAVAKPVAVAAGLAGYAPLIVPGGIMICEQAGHTPLQIGAYRALEHFMKSEIAESFCRIDLASGQTFLVRTHRD